MSRTKRESLPPLAKHLGPEDAAVFETFVVPRYLAFFGELVVELLEKTSEARICHLQCRTGYPDRLLVERLPGVHVYGRDTSPHAIELARAKASAIMRESPGVVFDYRTIEGMPLPFPAGAFSHAFSMHPLATGADRRALLDELARVVAPNGQGLFAMPLRGSFSEILDLLRECALKHELGELSVAVEAAANDRPTDDLFKRELEAAGFEHVVVDVRQRRMKFASGRRFIEDPIARLLLLPDFRINLALDQTVPGMIDPFAYVRDAIDKYWSDGSFELTVHVGVASGRRRA